MPGHFDQYVCLKRSASPYTPRSMPGHGLRMARYPALTSLPFSSSTAASMPKNGSVALPGLVSIAPGSGEIMAAPVSVCHQVSMMGQFLLPMVLWYHIHASGLIGSPTVPISRSDERSYFSGHSSPHFM